MLMAFFGSFICLAITELIFPFEFQNVPGQLEKDILLSGKIQISISLV